MYQSMRNNFLEYLFLKMVRATFVDIIYTQILQTAAVHVFVLVLYVSIVKKKKEEVKSHMYKKY